MKHILLVERFSACHKYLRKNYECEMTIILTQARLKESDWKLYDHIIQISDNASEDEWVRAAVEFHQHNSFDAIMCLIEDYQLIANSISKVIGLKYHNRFTIEAANHKDIMRQILHKKKLTNVGYALIENLSQLENFRRAHNVDLILKPFDGRGSMEIHKIPKELHIESDDIKFNRTYIAEEFIKGREYSVEGISLDGEHKIMCITKKIKDKKNFVEKGHAVPAQFSEEDRNEIVSYVTSVLDVIGMKSGCSHTEVMVSKKGVEIVETQLRFGGDFIPEMIEAVTGFSLMDYEIATFLNDEDRMREIFESKPLFPGNYMESAAVMFSFIWGEGQIKKISHLPKPEKNKNVVRVVPDHVGDYVSSTCDSFTRGTMVMVKDCDFNRCINTARRLTNNIRYLLE